jgi:CRP-like cAMP-binding protein
LQELETLQRLSGFTPAVPPATYHLIRIASFIVELAHTVLIRNLREHSRLSEEDADQIKRLSCIVRQYEPNEDLIRQGDIPKAAALVLSGTVGRYHLLPDGRRQYLAFHIVGDMPDAQGLFIDRMDHTVCAMDRAVIAFIPHADIVKAFKARPSLGFAIWRETLIDAAIFREAITNNSARPGLARMAHLFCELFYRARVSGVVQQNRLALPISLVQLGEALGMAIATVNRTLLRLRNSGSADFRDGTLTVKNWEKLARVAEFDPRYLHVKKVPPL